MSGSVGYHTVRTAKAGTAVEYRHFRAYRQPIKILIFE
jgi:hypothetical protein